MFLINNLSFGRVLMWWKLIYKIIGKDERRLEWVGLYGWRSFCGLRGIVV